jgi:hypothetical protein
MSKSLLLAATSTATTYRFTSPKPLGGWACCTVNDHTGEVCITSDWGNWAHRWNVNHLGTPTLTDFIAGGQWDYLARKLCDHATEFDAEATVENLHRILIERRRENRIDRDTARYVWDQIECIGDDCTRNADLFYERLTTDAVIDRAIGESPWECGRERPTEEYKVLVEVILPALVKRGGGGPWVTLRSRGPTRRGTRSVVARASQKGAATATPRESSRAWPAATGKATAPGSSWWMVGGSTADDLAALTPKWSGEYHPGRA